MEAAPIVVRTDMSWLSIIAVALIALFVFKALQSANQRHSLRQVFIVLAKLGVVATLFVCFLLFNVRSRTPTKIVTHAVTEKTDFPPVDERDLWALHVKFDEAEDVKNSAPAGEKVDQQEPAAADQDDAASSPAEDEQPSAADEASQGDEPPAVADAAPSEDVPADDAVKPQSSSRDKKAPPTASKNSASAARTESKAIRSPTRAVTRAEPRAKFPEFKGHDPSERPSWLTNPQALQRDTYYTTVTVGPYKTTAECEADFPAERDKAVKAYVTNYLGEDAAAALHVSPVFVNEEIVKEVYFEPVETTFGQMYNMHAQLGFSSRARTHLDQMWRDIELEGRLWKLGTVVGTVLLVLGTAFGYLKLDTLTRGYYTRRLQVAAVIILCVVASVVARLFVA